MNVKRFALAIYSTGVYFCFWFIVIILEAGKYHKNLPFYKNLHFLEVVLLCLNHLYLILLPFLLFFIISSLSRKRWLMRLTLIVISTGFTIFYEIYLFFLIYRIREGFNFYWYFFWYNRQEAVVTLFRLFHIISIIYFIILPIIIFTIFYLSFNKLIRIFKGKKFICLLIILLIVNVFSLIISPDKLKGEMYDFIHKNIFTNRELENYYSDFFYKHLAKLKIDDLPIIKEENNKLGSKIFFLHLESVNSLLISQEVTPNLIAAGSRGIFFPEFYSNSIQTLRSQENNLCGLPPTLKRYVNHDYTKEQIANLPCLPRILKQLGYKSLFFKDDKLDFSDTGGFMLKIGFDEVHNSDIMQPTDPKTAWGYREDVFFRRVFDYLEKNYKNDKIFVYIAISATNHTPFNITDKRYLDQAPYKSPLIFKERLANATFIQDAYLATFLEEFGKYQKDSSLFLFSDHAWPIGVHANNTYNEINAYEENFLTFLLFIPAKDLSHLYKIGTIIKERHSQMDILPTILELLNIRYDKFLGDEFTNYLLNNQEVAKSRSNYIVGIQPYNGGFISVINYPNKYLFDLSANKFFYFDLAADPSELSPEEKSNLNDYFYLISDFFNQQVDENTE